MEINVSGIPKAALLQALVNNTLAGRLTGGISLEEAQKIIDQKGDLDFDYVGVACIKTDLSGDIIDPWLYDRDHGEGAALKAVNQLRDSA